MDFVTFPFASSMTAFTSSTPLKSDKSIEFLSNSTVSSPSTITYIFVNNAASGPTTLALLPTTTIVGFFNQPKSRSVGSPVAKHPIPQKRNSASVVSFPKLTSGRSPLGLRSHQFRFFQTDKVSFHHFLTTIKRVVGYFTLRPVHCYDMLTSRS